MKYMWPLILVVFASCSGSGGGSGGSKKSSKSSSSSGSSKTSTSIEKANVSGFVAQTVGEDEITFSWVPASPVSSIDLQSIKIFSDSSCTSQVGSTIDLSSTSQSSYTFSDVADLASYTFAIVSRDSEGTNHTSDCSAVVTVDACSGSPTTYNQFGLGSESNPYLICNGAQFKAIADSTASWNSFFKLRENIDLAAYTGTDFTPIGNTSNPFLGGLDGNFKTINNFTYNDTTDTNDYVGIFGYVRGAKSVIKNLILTNLDIRADRYVGGLVGQGVGTFISNVAVSGSIRCKFYCGGIIGGATEAALISTVKTNVTIISTGNVVGGIVGHLHTSFLQNFISLIDITGMEQVGGAIGGGELSIAEKGYAAGDVTGSGPWGTGGIAGRFGNGTFRDSFFSGTVTGNHTSDVVGLVYGDGNEGFTTNYYDSAGVCVNNGTGNCVDDTTRGTPAALTTFYDSANAPLNNWDFTNVWQENAGAFPSFNINFLSSSWGSCSDHLSDTPFAGGVGTAENPYLICNGQQLNAINSSSSYWYSHFKVMDHIDLSGFTSNSFAIIGEASPYFNGYFDGNGKTISGLTYDDDTKNRVGIFSRVEEGVIKNIKISNFTITGRDRVGTLAGHTDQPASIRNILVDDTNSITGRDMTGGIIGYSFTHETNLFSSANVTSKSRGGGLFGRRYWGYFSDSVSVANVTIEGGGPDVNAGGPISGEEPNTNGLAGDRAFYDNIAYCSGCDNASAGTAQTDINYFYDKSNLPYSKWDFSNLWLERPGQLPDFR